MADNKVVDKELNTSFEAVWDRVKRDGAKVSNTHKSMGGMWGADTYKLGDIIVMLTDDGYGKAVIVPNMLNVYKLYDGTPESDWTLNFVLGDASTLEAVAEFLQA